LALLKRKHSWFQRSLVNPEGKYKRKVCWFIFKVVLQDFWEPLWRRERNGKGGEGSRQNGGGVTGSSPRKVFGIEDAAWGEKSRQAGLAKENLVGVSLEKR